MHARCSWGAAPSLVSLERGFCTESLFPGVGDWDEGAMQVPDPKTVASSQFPLRPTSKMTASKAHARLTKFMNKE